MGCVSELHGDKYQKMSLTQSCDIVLTTATEEALIYRYYLINPNQLQTWQDFEEAYPLQS